MALSSFITTKTLIITKIDDVLFLFSLFYVNIPVAISYQSDISRYMYFVIVLHTLLNEISRISWCSKSMPKFISTPSQCVELKASEQYFLSATDLSELKNVSKEKFDVAYF